MAKKIINSGKIYIDEALLKASRPITQKDTRGFDRKYYELDLSTANSAGASIYTADGTINEDRIVTIQNSSTITLETEGGSTNEIPLLLRNTSGAYGGIQPKIYLEKSPNGVLDQRLVIGSTMELSKANPADASQFIFHNLSTNSNSYTELRSNVSGAGPGGYARLTLYCDTGGLVYTDGRVFDASYATPGIQYAADYSADFVDRSIPDVAWVNSYTDQIRRTIVEIGDWDMDANQTTTVAHGLTFSKIRNVEGVIRNDANNIFYSSGYIGASGNVQWTTTTIDATNVTLTRRPGGGGGVFDDPAFSTTPFNRGWLIIDYVD